MSSLDINSRKFALLNFWDIIKPIEQRIFNDIDEYIPVDKVSFQNTAVKRIFFHHIILAVCKAVIEHETKNKIIVVFNEDESNYCNLSSISELHLAKKFFTTVIKKIKTLLPMNVYMYWNNFDHIKDVIKRNNGEYTELVENLTSLTSKCKVNFDFERVKRFSKRYGLTYLNKSFFEQIKTKNLLFK